MESYNNQIDEQNENEEQQYYGGQPMGQHFQNQMKDNEMAQFDEEEEKAAQKSKFNFCNQLH